MAELNATAPWIQKSRKSPATVELNVQLTMTRTDMLSLMAAVKRLEATIYDVVVSEPEEEHKAAVDLLEVLHQLLPEALWK